MLLAVYIYFPDMQAAQDLEAVELDSVADFAVVVVDRNSPDCAGGSHPAEEYIDCT